MSRRLLDLEEDHPRLVRARANWDVLVERKLRAGIAQARPGAGGGLLQPISLAIGNARVDTVLSVADRLRKYSQQVARICCEYAYRLAQDLDPNSQNRGMLQLKTGLLSIITQKKSKREGQAIDRRNDAKFIIDFYKTYRKKIDKLEALEEQWHERTNQGDVAPAAESKKRVAKIKEGYLTFRILNEVLDALIPDRTEKKALLAADQQEQGQGRSDIESDAARASEYKSYNILPLETLNATHLFEFLPQITGAQSALYLGNGDRGRQQDHLPELPRTVPRPNQRSEDMLDLLQYIFGFQKDNVNNQREHIILLLANTHARVSHPDGQANDLAVQRMHDKVLENYQRWCNYLRKESACRRGNSVQVQLLLTALYLLIWGEAGNIRFLPECLCYIFHNMAFELLQQLDNTVAVRARGIGDGDHEFLDQVIKPLYSVVAAEAKYGKGKTHTDWRNYDDLNEYFWSDHCFTLGWPMLLNQPFFTKPSEEPARRWGGQRRRMGKTLFAEHRTSFHIYHSFHRLWIFFLIMLQILVVIAFTSKLDGWHRARLILSFGPSYVSLKLFQSLLDFWMMLGAYKSTRGQNIARVFVRFLWFLALSIGVIFLYVMVMREADLNKTSALLNIYILVIGVYTAVEVATGIISRISAVRLQVDKFETWGIVRFISWVHQERFYVGRGMYESTKDCVIYVFFWVVILAAKFSFSYFFQIQPLVNPTRVIYSKKITEYNWFSFLSKDHHNMWTLGSLWGPVVLIYFLDTQVWYTVFSAIWGGIDGARMHLGEIRSLNMLSNRFRSFPEEFVKKLTPAAIRSQITSGAQSGNSDAQRFAPIWNEVIRNLRVEDYISNRERDLLLMPKNNGSLQEVQWPLFLLANKIALATNLSGEHKGAQQELEAEISDDYYMLSAVKEAYASVRQMLLTLVQDPVEQTWVRNVFQLIDEAKAEKALVGDLNLKKLGDPDGLVSKLGVLTKKLKKLKGISEEKIAKKHNKITETLRRIFETVMRDVLGLQLREKFISSDIMRRAREEPQLLFSNINWLSTVEKHEEIVRLHELLTIKVSASSVPKNDEARRRLEFFSNSLFMGMPATPSLQKMFSFSVLTPYYEEDVMFSYAALNKPNEDGITILFYLQKIFPDEWNNYLERVFHKESQKKHADLEKHFADCVKVRRKNLKDKEEKVDTHEEGPILQLRLWASYRGQTLARTVRGMMYYRSALVLLSELEDPPARDEEAGSRPALGAMTPSLRAQSVADMKFSYVVSCQIYGKLKKSEGVAELQKAADIGYLLRSYEGLRVAYIHSEEITVGNAPTKLFFSKLVKADAVGMEQEIYSIKLPGDPLLGEGKPENQNHAIVFTRGDAIQTIDMNQDNYFEETVKMRNLLQEFDVHHGLRKPSILGVREHVFTGSVSSLGWFMSNQETSFVTLGQRVLAKPLRVRMHYGHPDVFDRIFHISRGGISKASKVINISEDIYAGFNSTLRQGNVTHHEYIQVGKGRDVGLNQIAIFEGKVAGGNGEQVLSRDIYRLGQLFDPVRMLSFFYTSVGFYICTMMTVLTVYVFLYGKAYLALSGVETTLTGEETNNKALQTALNTQFLFQIGVFTAVPMIMGAILEQGVLKAFTGFVTMQLQAASVFFTFSLGTRTHYFGRTILHGGAKYRSTGRGFVVQHISFAENYRLFSRSHFVKGFEIALLLIVYAAYGSSKGTVSYILLTFSSWFLALSWLYAPFLFNPSGFEWQKAVEDFDKWSNWMFYKGGVGVKLDESWEAWWEDEMSHITSWWGRFWEIVFSLRFLIFQYGVVYSLNVTGKDNSLYVYGYSWAALVGLLVLWKVFTIGQRAAANAQLLVRAFQTVILVGILTSLVVLIIRTSLTLADVFAAFFLALLPTGWLILSICVALKPVVKPLGLWESVRSLARSYDALFGMLIFVPIAVLSWFPFVSTFQTRLVFNQAFSRGLEISLILSGKQEDESEESRERIVCLGGCKPKTAGQDKLGQDIPEQDRVVCFECENILGQAKKQD